MTRSPILEASLAAFFAAVVSATSALAQEPAPTLPPPPPPPEAGIPPAPPGPPPTPTAAPPVEPRVQVRFDANEPGLRVLALGGTVPVAGIAGYRYGWWVGPGIAPVYRTVCSEPCSAQLIPGQYQLALAKNPGGAVPVREPVFIQGPSAVVHGTYVDRSPLRIAGWVIGIAGTVGGALMIGASARGHDLLCDADGFCYEHVHYNAGLLGGGVAIVVASLVAGSILVVQHDEAHVTVQPLILSMSGAIREARVAALGAASPYGASMVVRF